MKPSVSHRFELLLGLALLFVGAMIQLGARDEHTAALASPATNNTSAQSAAAPNADMLAPLVAEATRRRAERAQRDPQGYARRVDQPLNAQRINFLVFGYGTTYEPPLVPPQYKGSIAIYSLDVRTLQVNTITLNHDIRTPEIERYVQRIGGAPQPMKMHFAYSLGGFELMRESVENATGLAVDFQLAFQDSVVRDFVDDVLGGVNVNVPFSFDAEAIYFQDTRYAARQYRPGTQRMDGIGALQFIKAIQIRALPYDPRKELAIRKQIVVQALLDALKQEAHNPFMWGKLLVFLQRAQERGETRYDFDASDLLFKSLGPTMNATARGQVLRASLGRSLYVVDRGNGDGGVEWVLSSRNPIMQREVKQGLYAVDTYLSVPLGRADPYAADLVSDYWPSVRQLVREWLTR